MREETDYVECTNQFKDDETVIIEPWVDRVDHLKVTIIGISNTPYHKGKFEFEVKLPSNYPYAPPYCYCQTLIWHPNIDPSVPPGKTNICLDLINPDLIGKVDPQTGASGWTPSKTLINVIEALKGMIHCQAPFFNPDDPLNNKAGEQYQKNPKKFNSEAKKWTEKYAMR
ncbi:MAG: ubiquitin-conjugating enzyme E2 [Candidatus Helarchaeota archaeon]